MIPKDPFLLLSWVNTQLRDFYPSLQELCKTQGLDRNSIEETLASIDFSYNAALNKFV